MAKKRMPVMVSEDTHALIMDEIGMLCVAHENGETVCREYNPDVKNPHAPKVSVDAFIYRLLLQRQQHRVRRRKAEKTKRTASARRPPRANVEGIQNAERG